MEIGIDYMKRLVDIHKYMGWSSKPVSIDSIEYGRVYYVEVTAEGQRIKTSIDTKWFALV